MSPARSFGLTLCLLAPGLSNMEPLQRLVTGQGQGLPAEGSFFALMPTFPERIACISPEPRLAAARLKEAFPRSSITLVTGGDGPHPGTEDDQGIAWRQGSVKHLELPARNYNLVIAFDVLPLTRELVRVAAVGGTVCLGYSQVGGGLASLLERRLEGAGLTKVESATASTGVLAAGIRFRPPTG